MGDKDYMEDTMTNKFAVSIKGIASAVSRNWESLDDYVSSHEMEEGFKLEKFKKNTGVTGRYKAGDYQTTSDFCYAAAEALISKYNIDRKEIGVLVFVSQTPDYNIPATACVLHNRLGLDKNCIAFDVNQGCSGFVYGLNIAASLLQTGNCTKALMLCGDTSAKSKRRGRYDTRTSNSSLFLFGDSGTATLLEKRCEEKNNIMINSCTDGSGYKAIIDPWMSWRHPWLLLNTSMDDVAVFNFAIYEVPLILNSYMEQMGTCPDDYDNLVLHQANLFIMKQIAKKTGFTQEKMAIGLDVFANTSSASIPNAIVGLYGDERSNVPKRLLCCGFGIGLSWAVVEINISPNDILPLVRTDEYFDDGLPEDNLSDPFETHFKI